MLKIGLTGNIASGKSVVQSYLETKGVPVIDADKVCHELLSGDNNTICEVRAVFADYDIMDGENISKKKIANIIYTNNKLKKELEKIIHPKVKEIIESFFLQQENSDFAVAAVPLLFEAGLKKMFDKIIFVSADTKTRLTRLMQRNNLSEEQALRMINAQQPESEKLSSCDFIVNNNNSIEDVYAQIDEILKILRIRI